jgi:hypothetical protein
MDDVLRFFEKNSENVFLSPRKWLNRKTNDYHQKVLLKSFPMNGHVSIFRQSKNFWAISMSRLVTEVTISPNQGFRQKKIIGGLKKILLPNVLKLHLMFFHFQNQKKYSPKKSS